MNLSNNVVVVDSGCDLPSEFIQNNPIRKVPLNYVVNGQVYLDTLSTTERLHAYINDTFNLRKSVMSMETTPEQMRQFIVSEIAPSFDSCHVQTISAARSLTHKNWLDSLIQLKHCGREARLQADPRSRFNFRLKNTGTLFTGQGVIAAHTADLIKQGLEASRIRKEIDMLIPTVRAYSVPQDVDYLRIRANQKGDRSVNALVAKMAKQFEILPIIKGYQDESKPVAKVRGRHKAINSLMSYAIARLQNLTSPYIVISYAGALSDLTKYEKYNDLKTLAKWEGVVVLETVMNLAGGLNLGPGAVCLALATHCNRLNFDSAEKE